MVHIIEYSFFKRKTTVTQRSSLLFEGTCSKQFWKPIWKIYNLEKVEVASFEVHAKAFSTFAMLKAKVVCASEDVTMAVHLHEKLFAYSMYCLHDTIRYDIYPHLYDKFSIYLNQQQVASLTRSEVRSYTTSRWVLLANNNLNPLFLLGLAYSIFILAEKQFYRSNDEGGDEWFKEAKKFDSRWLPV